MLFLHLQKINALNNFNYKNIKIGFSEIGKGKTIVLLHGFLENSTMWNDYVNNFAEYYRVITIDLLGHGETECMGYIHTMEDMAEAVKAVLTYLNIENALFVGHSMGGYVSLAIAEGFPKIVNGIVLLNSTAKEDSPERKINRVRAIKAVKQNYLTFVSMSIANLFSEDNRERLIDQIELVKQEAIKTPVQGIISALEGMKVRKDRTFILKEATFPILLILGKKDPVLNYEENSTLIENKSNLQLITLPDGHMSHIENKEVLGEILLNFFSQC